MTLQSFGGQIQDNPGDRRAIGTSIEQWRLAFPTAAGGTTVTAAFGAVSARVPVAGDGPPNFNDPAAQLAAGRAIIPTNGANFLAGRFAGVGDNDQVGLARLWEWRPLTVGGVTVWIPSLIASLSFTLSGALATAVATGLRFADAITVSSDQSLNASGVIVAPSESEEDNPARFVVDVSGTPFVEWETTRNGAVATSVQGFYFRF